MKNNEKFLWLEMEQIKMPDNIISQEVWKNLDWYNSLLNNILKLNDKDEMLPFEFNLAKLLKVPHDKILKILKPANDENYYKALVA